MPVKPNGACKTVQPGQIFWLFNHRETERAKSVSEQILEKFAGFICSTAYNHHYSVTVSVQPGASASAEILSKIA
jgi:hypothetical protein